MEMDWIRLKNGEINADVARGVDFLVTLPLGFCSTETEQSWTTLSDTVWPSHMLAFGKSSQRYRTVLCGYTIVSY